MRIVPYKEVQRFSQVRWLWFVLIALVIAELIIFAPHLTEDEKSIFLLLISMAAFLLPVTLILFVFKYELRIDETGIHYRFVPKMFRWKTIPVRAVESYYSKEKETLYEKIHYGYHRNLFKNMITINITGSKYLVLSLRSGGILKLGTENADSVQYTLKHLLKADNE